MSIPEPGSRIRGSDNDAVVGSSFDDKIILIWAEVLDITVCGDTRIEGDVRVPMADVRRGYIEGRPFTVNNSLKVGSCVH